MPQASAFPRPAIQPELFDLGRRYTVRTPRRGGCRAAQLWTDEGYWLVGLYETAAEARAAAQEFARSEPVPPGDDDIPPDNWVRCRRRADPEAPRWVRVVKGRAVQARFWLEVVGGSLNLGLFTLAEHDYKPELAEWAAARAADMFRKLWVGKRTVAECVEILQMRRPIPADAPPKLRSMRTPWVPTGVRVPAKWARLKLPTEYGETEFASERRERLAREREARRYAAGTLLDLAG
jgi:hypothetical protein